MKPFLEAIVIEGSAGGRRRLAFDPGVNVITGTGSKGKSAVLRIVEYCLGSRRCKVPVGEVQNFAAWYCLELNVRGTRAIIGRQAPSPSVSTFSAEDEAYYNEGDSAALPERLNANTSVGAALRSLGRLLGLPEGTFRLGLDDTAVGRVEVPELLPLLLQPQGIIASSETLFMGPEGDRHSRQRFQEIVEIALGIVGNDLLLLRAKTKELTATKSHLEAEKRKADKEERDERGKLHQLRQDAVSLGVLPANAPPTAAELRNELEQLRAPIPEASMPIVEDGTPRAQLEVDSRRLRGVLRRLSTELGRLGRVRVEAGRTDTALGTERARLQVVDVLGPARDDDLRCPLCDSVVAPDGDGLLDEMRASLDAELHFVAELTPELEGAERQLLERVRQAEGELNAVEDRIRALPQPPAPSLTVERLQRERLIGAVDHALRWTPRIHAGAPLAELAVVDSELREAKAAIAAMDVEGTDQEVRKGLSDRMTELTTALKRAELLGGRLEFDKPFSTVERIRGDRREPLSVIGGAENHVMYHVCALLALHEAFLRAGGPVPPLLILDQPSQAYFPSDADTRRIDMEAVRFIYDLLLDIAADCGGRLQIIALDHADFSEQDERFKAAKKYDWHGAEGLINS